jgi:DNA repair protein RecO (recombination protein O)
LRYYESLTMSHTSIILRTDPIKESDRTVTLFSLEHGLVRLIAKGSQKITSKNATALEPCTLALVGTAAGKELSYVTSVQPEELFQGVRSDLLKSAAGLYVTHFLARVLKEQEPHAALWQDMVLWLEALAAAPFQIRMVDAFVLRTMCQLGFRPNLVAPGIAFSIASGGIVDQETAREELRTNQQVIRIDEATIAALQLMIEGSWEDIQACLFEGNMPSTIHRIILGYAEYHLERKLSDWEKVIHSFE